MYHESCKGEKTLRRAALALVLALIGPAFGANYFWTGAVSTDAADPANWVNDGGASLAGTLPADSDVASVGRDSSYAVVTCVKQPILAGEWKSRTATAGAGWWIVVGADNSFTIGDGAHIEWSHQDGALRNGTTVRVTGQRAGGGPSLVIATRVRIGNNGDTIATATTSLIVEKNGYVRFDPAAVKSGSTNWQIYMGQATKALIDIRDNGIVELVPNAAGTTVPRFVFASADPATNKIVLSGNGQLILTGDHAGIAQVAGTDTSLQSLIDMGLIAPSNAGDKLIVSGTNPTTIKMAPQRVSNPKPAADAVNVDRYAVLSWSASVLTDKYDVYLGTNAADVNAASRTNPLGVLKSQSQTETYYPVSGPWMLEYGQTYYWRVDEVDIAGDPTMLKGTVWSFTVEPFTIPVSAASITATASSSFSADSGPQKTVDGSGLNTSDQHDTAAAHMWTSAVGQQAPVWIQYQFNGVYRLDRVWVWNSNQMLESLVGFGVKTATIEYSVDGVTWTAVSNVPEFKQAPGLDTYAHDTEINLGGIAAQFVRMTLTSSWGERGQYGLSEVRFFHAPTAARDPDPAAGATDVALGTTLSWIAGREAAEHKVYFGTDQQAVTNGTAAATTVTQTKYSPSLNLGVTYYWRVDEVNAAQAISTWAGSVWSFTTVDHLVVDDMESYNDTTQLVYQTWIDGYGTNNNGCQVGNDMAPFMNLANVHGGGKSMPFRYTVSGSYTLAEATRTFDAQDWTASGIQTLRLFFYGNTANTAAGLYVKIDGTKISYTGDAAGVSKAEWTQWDIPLSSVPASTLQSVTSLTLGAATGTGNLLFDDIRLYPAAP